MENKNINENKVPKSINHKIIWNKNDNINTCDLNSNCMKLEFDIKNKNFKILNDTQQINNIEVDILPVGNLPIYENFNSFNYMNTNDYLFIIFVFVILFVFFIKKKI